ncbi:MAG: DUF3854 domain-containing protein, partial [Actinomycetota bacterium]|nr:DUF3854 domain-containing protein [Actinomycetota bacterium]
MTAEYHEPGSKGSNRGTSSKVPTGCTLSERHAEYFRLRGVSRATAEAAGCWTASRPSEIPPAFSSGQRRRAPALVTPHQSPSGATGWQKRDDYPGKDKKGRVMKWVSPPADRCRPVLSVHPWTADEARTGTGTLWLPEGITRMYALAERGIAAVSYAGAWTWQKDGEPLACFDSLNLDGRLVLDVPDADYRINANVQKATALRVAFLEGMGAQVLVVNVPEVDGDEHAGLDDYIAAGGDLDELARDAAPFVPADVGAERMGRDEELRLFVAAKMREVQELQAPTGPACNGVKLARWMLENPTPAHGKLNARGAEIHPSYPQMAEGVRIGSYQTVGKALDWLADAGILEIKRAPRGSRLASSYVLLYPREGGSAQSVNIEGQGVGGKESQKDRGEDETSLYKRDSSPRLHSARGVVESVTGPEKVPALRNSKLVHTYIPKKGRPRGEVVHTDYFKRYGPKREEIVRRVIGAGGAEEEELHEQYGSPSSRLRDFRRRYLRDMLQDGVLVRDGSRILPA